jgi:hypothetical protein
LKLIKTEPCHWTGLPPTSAKLVPPPAALVEESGVPDVLSEVLEGAAAVSVAVSVAGEAEVELFGPGPSL